MIDIGKKSFRYSRKLIGRKRTIALSDAIFRARQALSYGPMLEIKSSIGITDSQIFLHGCLVLPSGQSPALTVISPQGIRTDITDSIHWSSDDVLSRKFKRKTRSFEPLFSVLVNAGKSIAEDTSNWKLELSVSGKRRQTVQFDVTRPASNPLGSVKEILQSISSRVSEKRDLFDHVIGPAISSLWSARSRVRKNPTAIDYGQDFKAEQARVALIIPLYGRFDFMEYQLNLFSLDSDFRNHEIIYIVDDPSIEDQVSETAQSLSRLYDMHFRVVYLHENLGFAGANNAGVEHCNAKTILLLNSDVMPTSSGWVSAMYQSLKKQKNESVLGARLLYEDSTVQHDGMEFFASPFMENLWINIHPGKGLPDSLLETSSEPVNKEAVTGACMMLSKSAYQALGGLNEQYILGDFEDSDLCLKAAEQNMDVLLDSKIKLYHLERQSQVMVTSDRWKDELTYYNCWQHTQQWDSAIAERKVAING